MAHLFRHGSTRELQQDFDAFGAPPPEVLEAMQKQDEFEVWPENVEPLQIFMRLQTQWRVGPMGHPIGLDYAGVRAALGMMRVRPEPRLFDDLQLMEREALRILSENSAP